MSIWEEVIRNVSEASVSLGRQEGKRIFYRGQRSEDWDLSPSLARYADKSDRDTVYNKSGRGLSHYQLIENHLYYQLFNRGGHLLPKNPGAWEIIFLMRHHGFPTRLLDWTTSFATALFFALQADEQAEASAIWLLSPGKLNKETRGDGGDTICFLDTDYPIGYEQYFAHTDSDNYGNFSHPIVATWADSSNERLRAQRGAFTLHADLNVRLENAFPSCVRKVRIPREAFREGNEFLYLAGIDSASLFPDLDSLAVFLVRNLLGQ